MIGASGARSKPAPGPLRRIVRSWPEDVTPCVTVRMEELECGHVQRQKSDCYGPTNAYSRRCRKCARAAIAKAESKKGGRRMKRASYRAAVDWIAQNDSAGDDDALDIKSVSCLVSSLLVADLFDVGTDRVGRDVVRRRRKLAREERLAKAEGKGTQ